MLKYISRARRKIIPQTVRLKKDPLGASLNAFIFFLQGFYHRYVDGKYLLFKKIWIEPFYLSDHCSKHKLFFITFLQH